MSGCHNTSIYLACSYQNLGIQKQDGKKCLSYDICWIGRNKKRKTWDATVHWHTKTVGVFHHAKDSRNFDQKSNGKFLLTGIHVFSITSGGGPLISVGPVQLKFTIPLLTNQFMYILLVTYVTYMYEGNLEEYNSSWLARFNWKMLFYFPQLLLRVSYRLVWHNGSTLHVINIIFWIILSSRDPKKKLAARCWWLGLPALQKSFPIILKKSFTRSLEINLNRVQPSPK